MGFQDNVNVDVRGAAHIAPCTYKTVVLKQNITKQNLNVLTQAMLDEYGANTKFIIKWDYVLKTDITIPANCILEFDGGSISGEFAITGNNTSIEAGLVKVFGTDITLAGTWNVSEVYPEWFGAKGDGVFDNTEVLNKVFSLSLTTIKFSSGTYLISNTIWLNKTEESDNKLLKISGVSRNAMNGNGTTIKTTSTNPILGIKKAIFGLYISEIDFRTTVSGGIGFDFYSDNNFISEFGLQKLKFVGAFNVALKINGSIGKIDDCYFCEVESTTEAWTNPEINRIAVYAYMESVIISNCNFWRTRTGIKIHKGVGLNITNNWFESTLHHDILCDAPFQANAVNIFNNVFLNVGYINSSVADGNASVFKFDGKGTSDMFVTNTLNVYGNRFYNSQAVKCIDFDWNSNSYANASFKNINIYDNCLSGQYTYLIAFNAGATSIDVSMYRNTIPSSCLMYNDQYDRQYKVLDVPKFGTTTRRNNYKYFSKGDTYFDTDVNKLLIFVGHIGHNDWADATGTPV